MMTSEIGNMRKNPSSAFTLIELMVVIAILGLLMGIFIPRISAMRENGKRAKAQAEVNAIAMAWKAYYNEYNVWPDELWWAGHTEDATGGSRVASLAFFLLRGDSVDMHKNDEMGNPIFFNKRSIRFMDFPSKSMRENYQGEGDQTAFDRAFVDPWGRTYRFSVDFNYDGAANPILSNGQRFDQVYQEIKRDVLAWSVGPDVGDPADDVISWQ